MGDNHWSWEVSPESADAGPGSQGFGFDVTVRQQSTVKAWFTSHGDEIKNADGRPVVMTFTNTGFIPLNHRMVSHVDHLNGKKLTDIKFANVTPRSTARLALAGFTGGEMGALGEFLLAHGYGWDPVGPMRTLRATRFPLFAADGVDLFAGFALDRWPDEPPPVDDAATDTRYVVEDGRVTATTSNDGLRPEHLVGYVFGNSDVRPDPAGGWTTADLFSGEIVQASTVRLYAPDDRTGPRGCLAGRTPRWVERLRPARR